LVVVDGLFLAVNSSDLLGSSLSWNDNLPLLQDTNMQLPSALYGMVYAFGAGFLQAFLGAGLPRLPKMRKFTVLP
jgi:hypothetical protein